MHPNSFLRCLFVWVFLLVALFCIAPSSFAMGMGNGMNTGMPTKSQGNSGLAGSSNVPIAPSRVIDFNKMGKNFDAPRKRLYRTSQQAKYFWNKAYNIITPTSPSVKSLPTTEKLKNLKSLVLEQLRFLYLETQPEIDESQTRSIPPLLPNNYLYTGAEVRTGDGKPVYSPVLGYGDNAAGFELAAEGYLPADGTRYNGNPDGLGISLKFNLWGLEQETQRHFQALNDEIFGIDDLKTLRKLLESDTTTNIFDRVRLLVTQEYNKYNVFPTSNLPYQIELNHVAELKILSQYNNNMEIYVNHTTRLSAALLVSDQIVNGGGDISSEGAVVSKLHSFGYDKAGVLMTVVAESFYDNLNTDYHRHDHSERLGLSVIYQDRTPYLTPKNLTYDQNNSTDASIGNPTQKYGFPWQYKIGAEYTSPIFGLKDTYAVFARYREPRHYLFDITLTYGADGAHKSYGNVSVGHIITF